VRRGALLVIPSGRALLYAEPIYLQAERSPMPELRLVVLALQDKLAYGPTFESAMAALFGGAASSMSAPTTSAPTTSARPILHQQMQRRVLLRLHEARQTRCPSPQAISISMHSSRKRPMTLPTTSA